MGIDEKLGWWLAPDGNWYPPELDPGQRPGLLEVATGAVSARIRPMGANCRFEQLHFGGRCVNCGATIRPHEDGWYDPDIHKTMCATCWPALVVTHRPGSGRAGHPDHERAGAARPR